MNPTDLQSLAAKSDVSAATPATAESALEKFDTLLQSPQAQAILAAAEARATALIGELPAAKPGTAPGWRTSEFWCLVVFVLLSLCTMLAGLLPARWAVVCQAFSVGLYQISRGLTKNGVGG